MRFPSDEIVRIFSGEPFSIEKNDLQYPFMLFVSLNKQINLLPH